MASKKSKNEQKFQKSLNELRNGIPVEPPKRKTSLRKKMASFVAGFALTMGGAHLIMDEDTTDTNTTPVAQETSVQNLYDFRLSDDFNTLTTDRKWNTPTKHYGNVNFNDNDQQRITTNKELGDIWLIPYNNPPENDDNPPYRANPWAGPTFGP